MLQMTLQKLANIQIRNIVYIRKNAKETGETLGPAEID